METNTLKSQEAAIRHMFEVTYPNYVKAGDAKGYASQFTADAIWMTPDGPTQVGPAAIENFTTALFQQLDLQPTIEVKEIEVTAKFAYVIGEPSVVVTPKDGSTPMHPTLRVIWILRKEGEEWKIARQVWNVVPQ